MNKNQYDAFCASLSNWEQNNVISVEVTYIIGASGATAQVRQGGLDNSHVNELIESIFSHGQQVPVTIEEVGKTDKGTTQYRLVDGEHRYRAFCKLAKANPKDMRWSNIRAYVRKFNSDYDRLAYQGKQNEHGLPSKPNSTSDATLMLSHVVDGNISGLPPSLLRLAGSKGRNVTSPEKYFVELQNALKILYPEMGAKKRKAVASKFVKDIPGKLRNYNASITVDEFNYWASDAGVLVPENAVIHSVKSHNYIDWQLLARLFVSKDDTNNGCENIVVMYWSDTQGKNHDNLDDHRVKMIKLINKRNRSSLLKKGRRLVDRVFIAPQKQNSAADEHGFYELVINGNGNFPARPPKSGWDTIPINQSQAAK